MTRYYAEAGNPPGFWTDQGLATLGHGELFTSAEVSKVQLELLIGSGRDPITGHPFGKEYPKFASVAEWIERRIKNLVADQRPAARAVAAPIPEDAPVMTATRPEVWDSLMCGDLTLAVMLWKSGVGRHYSGDGRKPVPLTSTAPRLRARE